MEKAFWLKNLFLIACLLFTATPGFSQNKTVTGTVTDATGEPLIGASVLQQGTSNGVITDIDGKYSIQVPPEATLEFSYVGMVKQAVKVGNRSVIDVQMNDDSQMLAETVVIGYGSAKKRDLTGSITNIKGDEIANKPVVNPVAALQGKIAGVQVINSGKAGADPEIRVRGTNSINGYKPLYVVDGLFNDNINFLNPQDIESMEILKDPSSLAIFGVRGANGVILDTRTDPDSPPIYPPAGMGDTTTGITLLSGVLAALLAARETGVGDYVMTSLYGTGNFVTAGFATNCNYGYEWPREAHTMSPLGQGYKCRDGRYIYVFVNDYTNVWPKFAKALRLPEEVVTDPRFTTKEATTIIANRSALVDIIREYALQRDAQDILDELVAYDVPSCILNQYKDRFSGEWLEQSVSNGYLIEHTYPSGNKAYLAQMPIYFDSLGVQDLYAQHRALGADNEAIEKEFGDGE